MSSLRWLPLALLAVARPAIAAAPRDLVHDYLVHDYIVAHAWHGKAVPSFARQTGLACSACHYQFLALTPFGRQFKLNGYTMTRQTDIAEKDSTNGGRLGLSPLSLFSAMLTAGVTHVNTGVPGAQNDAAALPQELSAFIAGRVAPNLGLFTQFTYAGADGAFGIDNLDIRYASKTTVGGHTELTWGLTLNNNPSIQDLWNTLPGWGFPFIGSDAAPGPAAATRIDGAFSQNVLGLGSYALVGNLVYAELSLYRTAAQGSATPTSATGAIKGVAPYWRVALQKDLDRQSYMLGTFGLRTGVFPDSVAGPHDTYTDVGVDAQVESKVGSGAVVVRGSWIHESQRLDATQPAGGSANTRNTLKTLRFNASWYPRQWVGVSGGYFDTRGSTDAGLYAPNPVDGSASGSPTTRGIIGEVDLNPWENARVGLQYTAYSRFNGRSSNYDGAGRKASANNTLFAFVWLAF